MTQDTLETFYPFKAGVGKGFPANFESGYYMPSFYLESSMEGDEFDDQNDDQENTDYENEELEVGGMEQTQQLPCFRQMVRAKKAELKAQYGKGHISIGECGIEPQRWFTPKYNPVVRIGEQKICIGWGSPSCNKKCLGLCCGDRPCVNWKTLVEGNTAAYDNATLKYQADKAAWDKCRAENKGIWVSGWRREWRKFKKAGGLNELKQQSTRCILGSPTGDGPILPPSPITTPTPTPTGAYAGMTCQQMSNQFGIDAGRAWGQAETNTELRNEWIAKNCKTRPASAGQSVGQEEEKPGVAGRGGATAPEADDSDKNKKMIIIGAIAVVVIIAIALVVRAMRSK